MQGDQFAGSTGDEVGFDVVGSQFEGEAVGGESVFGEVEGGAAMAEDEGWALDGGGRAEGAAVDFGGFGC